MGKRFVLQQRRRRARVIGVSMVVPARDALLTAAVTGSLFAVLPNLGEVARDILRRPPRP